MFNLSRFFVCVFVGLIGFSQGATAEVASKNKTWVDRSNAFTQRLIDVTLKHAPERGSHQGLAQFDKLISNPTLADEETERKELETVLGQLQKEKANEKDARVLQDLEILRKSFDLRFRVQDYEHKHVVPFFNASAIVFQGLKVLLDDQVDEQRRGSALDRLQKYAGTVAGFEPFTKILKQRNVEQMAKPDMVYPSKTELETELGRNSNYLTGMAGLFRKYKMTGWEKAFDVLSAQLTEYDAWIRTQVLPKARTDFRLPPEQYALAYEEFGIDITPAQMAALAHTAFNEIQSEMATLATAIAKDKGYSSSDYRFVIAQLKKKQITGDAILPFFKARLGEIEKKIQENKLVTLPRRPAIIRLATPAETVQQPAPHMSPPAFLHNTGEKGEFVLPLNIPSASGGTEDKYDDFTFNAASWTLTAHEARPGHELQFDSMVENGVSLARILFAFNSTNVEGWGLYSEYIMQPFEPKEGQLITLQFRLLRAARAFLDPELQSGKITPEQAFKVLEKDVVLSHAFAKEEVERFTFRMPGQANSYFYGYTKLLSLRKETESALQEKFDQLKFHDFMLKQGLLPPDLMRKAVLEDFVPSQKRL